MGFCNSCGEIVTTTSCKCGGLRKDIDGLDSKNTMPDKYLSLGFQSNTVENSLKTMLYGEVRELKCFGCGRVVLTRDVLLDPKQELPHCETCYSKTWSKGSCKLCQKPVLGMGKEWVREGKDLFHKQCYKAKRCNRCSKDIYGSAVVVDDLLFHKDCFCCEICSSNLTNVQFAVREKTLVCINCSKTLKKSSNTSSSAVSQSQGGKGIETVVNPHTPIVYRGNEGKELCLKCQKPLSPTDKTLQYDSGLIHATCLTCDSCHKLIDNNTGFVKVGEKVYHQNCIRVDIPDGLVCKSCKQVLGNTFMTFEEGKFHSKCFNCFKCGKNLVKVPFGKVGSQVACETCLMNAELRKEGGQQGNQAANQAGNQSGQSGGDRKAGFTVNPMTGKREVRDQVYADNLANNLTQLSLNSKSKVCPFCSKSIFPGEMVPGPGVSSWHQGCLKCVECKKQLDSLAKIKDDNPYCSSCFLKR